MARARITHAMRPLLYVLVAMLGARVSVAQTPQPITSCVKLAKAGLYEVDASLSSAGSNDCLVVSASNVILNLNGMELTGTGGGAGVHVMSSASNAMVEGHDAVIQGFSEGVEIDGSKDVAENFTATNNLDAGVLLNNAKQAKLSNFTTSFNLDGVRVSKGSYNAMTGAIYARDNLRYGIWLTDTNHNSVGGFTTQNNPAAGVYLGCSATGPTGAACKLAAKNTYNSIFNGSVQPVNGGAQQYGVAIDLGGGSNRVTNVSSAAPGDAIDDLIEENPDCGTNDWFGHGIVFSTSPPSGGCIN
jgi:hypothetical protein